MLKTCLKCGHPNHEATGAELEPCPSCGAIYSRVESAWRVCTASGRAPKPSPVHPEPAIPRQWAFGAHAAADEGSVEQFAVGLRASSLYPTFRELVRLLYWVTVLLAVVGVLGGVMVAWHSSGAQRFGSLVTGVMFGLFWLIVARATREMSLMLADLADAAVRIASRVRP